MFLALDALFSWVLSSSITGSVIIALILLVKFFTGKKLSPTWHYYIWLILLARLLVPYFPESSVSLSNLFSPAQQVVQREIGQYQNYLTERAATSGSQTVQSEKISQAFPGENTPPEQAMNPANGIGAWDTAKIIWLVVSAAYALVVLVANLVFHLRLRRQRECTDEKHTGIVKLYRLRLGISFPVPIIFTPEVRTPSLSGLFRPKILIPTNSLDKLTESELKYVVVHELCHLKRLDIAINWVVAFLQIIHWFNPLIWYAFYRMADDCEIACDAMALKQLEPGEHTQYGGTIITLLTMLSEPYPRVKIARMAGGKSQIKRRLTMINSFKPASRRWSLAAVALTVIILLVAGCSAARVKEPVNPNPAPNSSANSGTSNAPLTNPPSDPVNKPSTDTAKLPIPNLEGIYVGQPEPELVKVLGTHYTQTPEEEPGHYGESWVKRSYDNGITVVIGQKSKQVLEVQTESQALATDLGVKVGDKAQDILVKYRAKFQEAVSKQGDGKLIGWFLVGDKGELVIFDFNKADGAVINKEIKPDSRVEIIRISNMKFFD